MVQKLEKLIASLTGTLNKGSYSTFQGQRMKKNQCNKIPTLPKSLWLGFPFSNLFLPSQKPKANQRGADL
jgi:hypothetical protein